MLIIVSAAVEVLIIVSAAVEVLVIVSPAGDNCER